MYFSFHFAALVYNFRLGSRRQPQETSPIMPSLRLLTIALVSVFCMSLVPVLVRSTIANETTIGVVRLLIAAGGFTPLILVQRKHKPLSRRDWGFMLLIGLVFAIHWLTYFISIKLSSAALGAMAITTYGVQYVLLAWVFNGESIRPVEWLALGTCFSACLVAAPELDLDNSVTLGIAIGVVSATFYAALPLLHQRIQHVDATTRSWGQFSFALLAFACLWPYTDWHLQSGDWRNLVLLGVVCTLIAHSLWVKASTELPAVFSGLIYYLYIPLAMLQAVWFLGEEMTASKLVAMAMILGAGVTVTAFRWYRRSH